MLVIDTQFKLDAAAISATNLCDRFSDDDLKRIGEHCHGGYTRDETSREKWMKRNEAGMDLALQIQKDKTFPWPNCANVAFPLVTIAAMQFHARAYPAIVNGTDIVKCAVFGQDPDGQKTQRADRVSTHMSWQLLYEDKAWEDQEDKAILNLSIVGTNFKKSYRSSAFGYNVSELVLAKDLVLDYWSKSVETAPRKTHKLPTYKNEVYENVMRGKWRDILEEPWYQNPSVPRRSQAQIEADNRQGITPPPPDDTTSLLFLEQHCNLDLDQDGYAEPYIITFEDTSKCPVRIVARFNSDADIERVASGPNKGKIIRIAASEYFTKKTFIPSPDGGIYDIGFGVFLGPLNEAVNSLVNMLLDAGTMQTTSGGFLGRGAKIRGGTYTAGPFEWKRVDSTGDDLRKSIYKFEINEPSQVLFSLLSLLINYTNRIAGTTDMMVGENPGQNTPAETARTMVVQGEKIYSAIFKRIWRASKEEFQKLFKLNGQFLLPGKEYVGGATRDDYIGSGDDISPVADPTVTSDTMRMQIATAVMQAATSMPGFEKDEAVRRWLKAMHVEGLEQVFPGSKGTPPPEDPKLTAVKLKIASDEKMEGGKLQLQQAELAASLMEERRLNDAKILELNAKAMQESANAQSEQAYAQVAAMNAQIALMKTHSEHLNAQIDHLLRAAEIRSAHLIGMKEKASAAA